MSRRTTDAHPWIASICRQLSAATGWPFDYTPASGVSPSVLESQFRDGTQCCWFSEIHDGAQTLGYLHVNLPPQPQADRMFPAVRELAELVSDLLGKHSAACRTLETRTEELSTLADIGLSLPKEENLLGAIEQLLRAAVQLTGFRSAAFFLLDPATDELRPRALFRLDPRQVPVPHRPLTRQPPDLEALVHGPVVLERGPRANHWLPPDTSSGVCVPVQSADGPLGTLWTFDRRQRFPSDRELHVLKSIAAQVAAVLERVVLLRESAIRQRVQQDLRAAAEYQRSDLLRDLDCERGFRAAGLCTSRYEVGGDLCELIPLDAQRTLIAVGDASGDSIPAALVMSAVRGAVRALAAQAMTPDRPEWLVANLNRTLYGITHAQQFMSLVCGVFDAERKTFTYSNAGHPKPLLVRNGQEHPVFESHGLLLGVLPEAAYRSPTVALESGDLIVCFTDGISEAMNVQHEMFRPVGILESVSGRRFHAPEEAVRAILENVERHTAGHTDGDDRTLLALRIE